LARGALQDLDDLAGRTDVGAARAAQDADEHLVAGGGVEAVLLADADLGADVAIDGVRPHVAGAGGGLAEDARDGGLAGGGRGGGGGGGGWCGPCGRGGGPGGAARAGPGGSRGTGPAARRVCAPAPWA